MRNSGFSLVETMASLTLSMILMEGVLSLFQIGGRTVVRLRKAQEKTRVPLLARLLGSDLGNSYLLKKQGKGWEYFRAIGIGIGKNGKCRVIYGRKGKINLVEGKLAGGCNEGKFFLALRRKYIYLKGNTLYMKISDSNPQPLEEGIENFKMEVNGETLKIFLNGQVYLRRMK